MRSNESRIISSLKLAVVGIRYSYPSSTERVIFTAMISSENLSRSFRSLRHVASKVAIRALILHRAVGLDLSAFERSVLISRHVMIRHDMAWHVMTWHDMIWQDVILYSAV